MLVVIINMMAGIGIYFITRLTIDAIVRYIAIKRQLDVFNKQVIALKETSIDAQSNIKKLEDLAEQMKLYSESGIAGAEAGEEFRLKVIDLQKLADQKDDNKD